MTYRDPGLVRAITENVIPVKLLATAPENQAAVERYLQIWTPDLRLVSPAGKVYHEWVGYFPPSLYLAQLTLGRGKAALKEHRFAEAMQLFDDTAELYPTSDAAPEAVYWSAVARYKASGRPEDLRAGMERLRARYPESIWRVKQSYFELPPPPPGR